MASSQKSNEDLERERRAAARKEEREQLAQERAQALAQAMDLNPELTRSREHYEDAYWAEPPVFSPRYAERVSEGRNPHVEFTPERKDLYLRWLSATGLRNLSAERAGINYGTVQAHRKSDPLFAELEAEAKESHTDSMAMEAQRRAIRGVIRPIIGGKFKDEIITYEVEYSDRLLETLLRANRSEFRGEKPESEKQKGGVMIIPGGPMSAEEWQAQYGEAAKGRTGAEQHEGAQSDGSHG